MGSKKKSKKTTPIPSEAPEPKEPRAPKPKKQPDLPAMEGPGVAVPSFPELDAAIEEYVSVRDRRMALTKEEVSSKGTLRDLMHQHQLERYPYNDYVAIIVPGEEKLKVKVAADEKSPEELAVEDEHAGDGE